MENIKSIRNREAAKGGLVLGLVMYAILFVDYITEATVSMKVVTSIINVSAVSFVLYYYSRKYANYRANLGTTYSTAFGFIVLVSLFAGMIYGTLYFIQTNYIDPAYYEQINREIIVNNASLSNDEKDLALNMIGGYLTNPFVVIFSAMLSSILSSAFFGLVIATFVKREKVQDTQENESFDNKNKEVE